MARHADARTTETDSDADATSPLLPQPATAATARRQSLHGRTHASRRSAEDPDPELAAEEQLDDGETAYAKLRWIVSSLIIAAFIAIILWLALGDAGARSSEGYRDPGFPGEDEVGYEGPTPTVRTARRTSLRGRSA